MAPYKERYPKGTPVRIIDRPGLERFRVTWTYHHPLTEEQLAFADHSTVVANVSLYHGGDPLYELRDVPGIWHESCLCDS